MELTEKIKLLFASPSTVDGEDKQKFGIFLGVFVPCILMLFGVIIFLRLGWIVGQVGLITTSVIITFAFIIALFTTLSMAAIATNIEVGKGGIYYLLSRSLGIEIGSAIGLPLYIKQTLSIVFCILGFAESLHSLMPSWPIPIIGIWTLAALTILAYTSVNGAMKVQLVIFAVIGASLTSLFTGTPVSPAESTSLVSSVAPSLGFWGIFAIFFPAMTGVESSVSLSGDIRNPSRSLPIGTITAMVTAYLIYMIIAFFVASYAPLERLAAEPLIMQEIARIPSLIILGIWGATLSSALGGMLGAPRTLQAMSDDGIIPKFFGKTYGPMQEPRVATLITCIIALGAIYYGSINIIAPLMSMICLICYVVLNLSAGIETLMDNPSWRPRFRVHWSISIAGGVLSLITMIMIDAGAALIAFFFVGLVYFFAKKRQFNTTWVDIRQGILLFFSRMAIYQLNHNETKSWRPHFLVFTKHSKEHSNHLLKFVESISQSRSFLTMVSFVKNEQLSQRERIEIAGETTRNLSEKNIEAFVQIKTADTLTNGMMHMIENYGLGPIKPNTVVFGEIKDEAHEFVQVIQKAYENGLNIVINSNATHVNNDGGDIHVWWDEDNRNSSEFMLVLAYMLSRNKEWKKKRICLKAIVRNEFMRHNKLQELQNLSAKMRMPIDIEIFVSSDPTAEYSNFAKEFSGKAGFVFLSLMPPPDHDEMMTCYKEYIHVLRDTYKDLSSVGLVLSSADTPLETILA